MTTSTTAGLLYLAASCASTYVVAVWIVPRIFRLLEWMERRKKLVIAGEKIPGPRAWPIIGNTLDLYEFDFDILKVAQHLARTIHTACRFWVGPKLYIAIHRAADVEAILSNPRHISKSDDYNALHPWLGRGLLTSDGDDWRARRKLLTPSFHFNILEEFIDVFNRNGDILIEKLKSRVNTGVFDILEYLSLCTLDIICESAMGTSVNAQTTKDSDYVACTKRACKAIYLRAVKIWLRFDPLFDLSPTGRSFYAAVKTLRRKTRSVIAARKREYESKYLMKLNSSATNGDGAAVNNNDSAANGYGYAANGNGHAVNGNGYAASGNGHVANGNSAAVNGNGSAVNGNGSAVNGNGSAVNGNGSAVNGNGHAANGNSPAVNGNGYAANGNSHAVHGNAINGNGYAANGNSHAVNGNGFAVNGNGYAANSNGLDGNGHAVNGNGHINGMKIDQDNNYVPGVKKRKAFLDLLLEASYNGAGLTDDMIREEVDTFMFEGHDTTAAAISFALYELSANPDVQDKVVEELDAIFGDSDRQGTLRDAQEMRYMDQVIKETLRLYPSVPIFLRKLREDLPLSNNLIAPAGSTMAIFAIMLARDEGVFPEPEKFDPDRFISGAETRHPYSYIPFSAGQRNCIGQKFAVLEMKMTLSKILRNYRLVKATPDYKPDLICETILTSRGGILIRLEPRKPS